MKPALKRIEASLQQLENVSTISYPKSAAARNRILSFEIHGATCKHDHTGGNASLALPSLSVKPSSGKVPTLPNFKPASDTPIEPLSSPPQVTNPLQTDMLSDIATDVANCTAELEQLVTQIQNIYMDGPLVDGWLESHPSVAEPVADLIDYVEEALIFEKGKVTCESPRPGYRLCGFDSSGQKWSHPCPIEQLPSVSVAIARYQKLRQLLERRQYLQAHLKQMYNSYQSTNDKEVG